MGRITSRVLRLTLIFRAFIKSIYIRVLGYLLISAILAGCYIIGIWGYSATWRLHEENGLDMEEFPSEHLALIEEHPHAFSTGFNYIQHKDLGIEKGSTSFRGGRHSGPKEIYTPPGKILLSAPYNGRNKPQVVFYAKPGGKYWLSRACVSTRFTRTMLSQFIVIVDADSQSIIATDDFCPDCAALIGTQLSRWPCTNIFSSDIVDYESKTVYDESQVAYNVSWVRLRIICDAAERGIPSARFSLGRIYEWGEKGNFHHITQNNFLSYYWYEMAAQQEGDDAFIDDARFWQRRVKEKLTSDQIKEANRLIRSHKPGTCENQLFGAFTCDDQCMKHIKI